MSQFSMFENRINKQIKNFRDKGYTLCCWCVLRYCYILKAYRSPENILSEFLTLKNDLSREELQEFLESDCPACLDILKQDFRHEIAQKVKEDFNNSDYDLNEFEEFDLVIQLPICLTLRNSIFYRLFCKHSFDFEKHIVLKELFKIFLSDEIAKILGKKYNKGAMFKIDLDLTNAECDQECWKITGLESAKKRFKDNNEILNHSSITRFINDSNESIFKDVIKSNQPKCTLEKVKFYFDSLFLAGRYNKYSRTMSQTPWIVNNKVICESSIEETIAEGLKKFINYNTLTLSSSGREDVDVRMLGKGRPFLVELSNPRSAPIQTLLQPIMEQYTGDIRVRDLTVVSREQALVFLKDPEGNRSKTYEALCIVNRPLTPEEIEKISQAKNVEIVQSTPMRVMHRRTVADRTRTVHEMTVIPMTCQELSEEFPDLIENVDKVFKLRLVADAGTYIKEFVHSDFGRTAPSLVNFLSDDAQVDIIALDVTEVNCDWPTPLNENN